MTISTSNKGTRTKSRLGDTAQTNTGGGRATKSSLQGELFVLDSPLRGGVRGERSLMAYPFFALSKHAWMSQLRYESDGVTIEVNPGHKGIATIYDKEVLLYIASLMATKIEESETVTRDFQFTAHDLFRVTGTAISSKSYEKLFDALDRLQSTQIRTNIETGGEGEDGFFSWVENVRLQYTRSKDGGKRLKAVRVTLCEWLHRAIMKDRDILKYAPAYFQLSPVNRRLYEIACATCPQDGETSISLGKLRLQIGYQSPPRHFKQLVKEAVRESSIPGFVFAISEQSGRTNRVTDDIVTIRYDWSADHDSVNAALLTLHPKPIKSTVEGADQFVERSHR